MKKQLLSIIVFLVIQITTYGNNIGILKDGYFKTPILRVDERQFYIVDQELKKGFIFDRKTFKKVTEFGGPGQGPGEFSGITGLAINDKYIYVSNFPKLSIFSKQGQLVEEIKLTSFVSSLKPIGEDFIGHWFRRRTKREDPVKIQFSLYDAGLNKKKDLLYTEIEKYADFVGGKKIIYWIRDCAESFVYKDRIYIGTTAKGFYFSVFDQNGNKLYDIKRDYKKRNISEKVKKTALAKMRKGWGEERWSQVKVIIRDCYPAYQAFLISDDKIYVFGFPLLNYEIHILDLEGNLLKKKSIPYNEIYSVSSRYSCMHNGKLYKLLDMHECFAINEIDIWNYDALGEGAPARELYSKIIDYIKQIFFILEIL
jgi:hypothetical protein